MKDTKKAIIKFFKKQKVVYFEERLTGNIKNYYISDGKILLIVGENIFHEVYEENLTAFAPSSLSKIYEEGKKFVHKAKATPLFMQMGDAFARIIKTENNVIYLDDFYLELFGLIYGIEAAEYNSPVFIEGEYCGLLLPISRGKEGKNQKKALISMIDDFDYKPGV